MCTAVAFHTHDFYFGRTLDLDRSYGEEVVITPRSYPFRFRRMGPMERHYAMIGIAHVEEGFPLYYEGINEKGLGMAGLNFIGNARYQECSAGWDNVSPFEFIPWILSQCTTVREAKKLLQKLRLVSLPFREDMPLSQLHWMISDRTGSIVVESTKAGLFVYDNPAQVLTNNPPFEQQLFQLNNYMSLSPGPAPNHFSEKLPLESYSYGMGTIGMPGGLSSQARFVRAAFVCLNSLCGSHEAESVSQFFHILGSVEQQKGCCRLESGKCQYTLYTCCCNADKGILYYTTYENHQITAADMNLEDLSGSALIRYPMITGEQIHLQNAVGTNA